MLIFGDYNSLPKENDFVVFNLSSLVEGFETLSLVPPFIRQFNDEKQFDIMYANYLISDDNAFFEMMKIVMSLYMGKDVYVLITRDGGILEILTESLQKFIQQRYGIISININCIEDLKYIEDVSQFTIQGLYNLDIDKERFSYMYYTKHPEELELDV